MNRRASATETSTSSAPERGGIFWGWWIVVGAVVGQFVGMGVGGSISGVFLRPVTEDLDWTSAEFTLGASAALLVAGLANFVIGPLTDRYGARPLMLVSACIYAGSFLALSRVDALWQFILLWMLAGGIGFSLVGSLVVNVTLAKWFVARRGWAVALGSSGISLAGLIMPVIMTRVVDSIGWRDAYVLLAIFVFAILVPVALFMRRRPEDYGMLPDGTKSDSGQRDEQSRRDVEQQRSDAANSYTRREAIRTSAIWLLIAGYALHTMAILGGIGSCHPVHDRQRFHTDRSGSGDRIERRSESLFEIRLGILLATLTRPLSVRHVALGLRCRHSSDASFGVYRITGADVLRLFMLGIWVRWNDPVERVHLGQVLR